MYWFLPEMASSLSYPRIAITPSPSRLSPQGGIILPDLMSAGEDSKRDEGGVERNKLDREKEKENEKEKEKDDAPKRGYRACVSFRYLLDIGSYVHLSWDQVHCRLRKAKCDLGDVNAPSEPPCSRCRREQRSCVFLPSVGQRHSSLIIVLNGGARRLVLVNVLQKRRRKNGHEDGDSWIEVDSSSKRRSVEPRQDWKLPPSDGTSSTVSLVKIQHIRQNEVQFKSMGAGLDRPVFPLKPHPSLHPYDLLLLPHSISP